MTKPVQGGIRQMRQLEVIANHLANADTAGFKRDILTFDDAFKAQLNTDQSLGELQVTSNPLDLALTDEGFFTVQTPRGVRYTRNGTFTLDNGGFIVTSNGDPVLGEGGPIQVDGQNITITETGGVMVDNVQVDILSVVSFTDLDQLHKEGSSLFVNKGGANNEVPAENVNVKQGVLEKSNVTTVVEMTTMIETHRLFEAYQKTILAFDETDSKAISEVGRAI